jgi:hypothetical protein
VESVSYETVRVVLKQTSLVVHPLNE